MYQIYMFLFMFVFLSCKREDCTPDLSFIPSHTYFQVGKNTPLCIPFNKDVFEKLKGLVEIDHKEIFFDVYGNKYIIEKKFMKNEGRKYYRINVKAFCGTCCVDVKSTFFISEKGIYPTFEGEKNLKIKIALIDRGLEMLLLKAYGEEDSATKKDKAL